jgi:hypothetical protein
MKSSEWLVFDDQVRYRNRLANRFLGHPATPLPHDLLPGQPAVKLLQDNPHHDPCPFERGLAAANPGVRHNMPAQFNPVVLPVCFRFHADAPKYAPAQTPLQAADRTLLARLQVPGVPLWVAPGHPNNPPPKNACNKSASVCDGTGEGRSSEQTRNWRQTPPALKTGPQEKKARL